VLDTTTGGEIVGIEIFDATGRLLIQTRLQLEIWGKEIRGRTRATT
jgi:uncharacterized protein YuzE